MITESSSTTTTNNTSNTTGNVQTCKCGGEVYPLEIYRTTHGGPRRGWEQGYPAGTELYCETEGCDYSFDEVVKNLEVDEYYD